MTEQRNGKGGGAGELLLRVEDLRTYFKAEDGVVKAVDGVSFEVRRGETIGIVGESGSGKSVTSASILRLVPEPGYHAGGQIEFAGQELSAATEADMRRLRGDRISMIFQDPMTSLNPFLTVERQLTEVLELHRDLDRRAARRKAIEMLERVGIPDPARRIDQYPHQFSGGMRQRVMIAMALLCEPELLIADEPTTALDVTIQAQILDLIKELQGELGMSVLLITHDLGVVAGLADRVLVMYAGRVVEAGSTDRLYAAPRHPYTQGLLASVPRLDSDRDQPLIAIPGLPPDLSALPSGCPFRPRCPRAIARCAEAYPDRIPTKDGGFAACWRADEPGTAFGAGASGPSSVADNPDPATAAAPAHAEVHRE